jgi:hypothetical protein
VVRVETAFVIVHSLAVGPATWEPVAARLRATGATVLVPSLLPVADGPPPFWPTVVDLVGAAIDTLPAGQPVVLVCHSNAGRFLPVIAEASRRPVAGCVFVDAALPARTGATPVANAEHLAFLRGLAVDGRLPQWTSRWDEAEVAPLFPDRRTREWVCAEQPRLPLAFYEQSIPVPAGWDDHVPCAYVYFCQPYEAAAGEAWDRGWRITHLPGRHLHQLVDPDAVADVLRAARTAGYAGRSS